MKDDVKTVISEKLTPKQRKIAEALIKCGVNLPCPRCGNTDFVIVDNYVIHPLTSDLRRPIGKNIPTAITICEQCGYVSEHALGALQLLPKEEEKESK